MNQHWNNKEHNFRQGYFQGNHSSIYDENSQMCNTRAYLNPQIVNYELIRMSLFKNSLQKGNKIHVNPNFKGNAISNVNNNDNSNNNNNNNSNNQHLINTSFLNSQNSLLCNPGTSTVRSDENKSSAKVHLTTNGGDLKCSATTPLQSCFKKINAVNQKSCNNYSWFKNKNDKPDSHSYVKNSGTVAGMKSVYKKSCNFNYNQNIYLYKSPKKIINQSFQTSKNHSIYKSATKIINESKTNSVSSKTTLCLKEKGNNISNKNCAILSKFIYNKNKKLSVLNVAKAVRSKYKFLSNSEHLKKSKYKIDKRIKLSALTKKKSNLKEIKDLKKLFPNYFYNKLKFSSYNIFNLHNNATISKRNYSWRNSQQSNIVNQKIINQFPNRRVVKIGGILYKSTANKLTLANKKVDSSQKKTITSKSKAKKIHVLYVRGEKFILENNGKALRRHSENTVNDKAFLLTPKRIDIGGVTYLQKSQNVLIRTNVHEARQLVNRAKNKSIALLANLYKRSSMPCMIYHRFGRCIRHTKGLCMYKHDPKNIAVCKKFLQGKCINNNCLLSHQVAQEKMATCHFFLKGLCFRENCPFLHVKLNKNAGICENFLQGFCNLGKECCKRHLHMCPNFDKYGSCNLGSKCHYPHKKLKETEETFKHKGAENINEKSNQPNDQNETVQYYLHSDIQGKQKKTKKSVAKFRNINKTKVKKKATTKKGLCLNHPDQNNDVIECFPKRIKLDKLPCYIPLNSDP